MAGDVLLTVNGERARRATIERLHGLAHAGDAWTVLSLRQDLLREATTAWELPQPVVVHLDIEEDGRRADVRKRLRAAWMAGHPSPQ